jgi:NAD(P)-dependent dehydrogenase (short-subunit alcohol dehydrogenase family)
MDLELRDHVAVVTGGASGIGLHLRGGIGAGGMPGGGVGRQGPGSVDVSVLESVQEALRETEERLGPVRHLVHAAAMGSGSSGFRF